MSIIKEGGQGLKVSSFCAHLQALEHEKRMALPEYAGQGADSEEEGSEDSDMQLEDDMDAALREGALNSVAQVCYQGGALDKRNSAQQRQRPSGHV